MVFWILFLETKVEIGQGILSMCPMGQGNGFCPSQSIKMQFEPK